MNPELQQRIAAIKSQCEEILRLSKKATDAFWHTSRTDLDSYTVNHDDETGDTEHVVYLYRNPMPRVAFFGSRNREDADLCASSRNASPAMARVVLATIQNLEDLIKLGAGIGEQYLESIANQWEGK